MKEKPGIILKKSTILMKFYRKFLYDFSPLYGETFPKLKIKIKQKTVISPWITKGIMKSSKQKQKLYNKFLKSRTKENEVIYKAYKNLFEVIRKTTPH